MKLEPQNCPEKGMYKLLFNDIYWHGYCLALKVKDYLEHEMSNVYANKNKGIKLISAF